MSLLNFLFPTSNNFEGFRVYHWCIIDLSFKVFKVFGVDYSWNWSIISGNKLLLFLLKYDSWMNDFLKFYVGSFAIINQKYLIILKCKWNFLFSLPWVTIFVQLVSTKVLIFVNLNFFCMFKSTSNIPIKSFRLFIEH